jgi:hypothetical protein
MSDYEHISVKLPPQFKEALFRISVAHGFSMAAMVRSLIRREAIALDLWNKKENT